MAKKITINSNVKLVTSGTAPTLENLKKGVFQYRADGAVIVDLGRLGEKVLLR